MTKTVNFAHRLSFRLPPFAICTTFRGICTCLTESVPSSRACTKTSSFCRFIGSDSSSSSLPYSLIFLFFAKSSWQSDTRILQCRWSDFGQQVQYESAWVQESSDMQGSHLAPLPDFASHSPFGGPCWFELHCAEHNRSR